MKLLAFFLLAVVVHGPLSPFLPTVTTRVEPSTDLIRPVTSSAIAIPRPIANTTATAINFRIASTPE